MLKVKVEEKIRLSEEWNEELISGITKLLRGLGVHREPIHPVAPWYITPPYIMSVTRTMVLQSLTTVAAKQLVLITKVEQLVSTMTVEQPVSTMTAKNKAKNSAWWKCRQGENYYSPQKSRQHIEAWEEEKQWNNDVQEKCIDDTKHR